MDISAQLNEIIENTKDLALTLEQDNRMTALKSDLTKATQKAVDHAAKYVIKAMPVPDAVKDILTDMKDALKTKDIKKVIGTVVKSTVREGLETIGISDECINSIVDLKNVATKGGLITSVKNGIEIVAKNYLKDNIVGDYVYDFFDKLEGYVMNKEFSKNLNSIVNRLQDKKDEYLEKCESWYAAYKQMDLEKIKNIAGELKEDTYILSRYTDCIKENNIIQNMTAMINNRKEPLTLNQERLCQVV